MRNVEFHTDPISGEAMYRDVTEQCTKVLTQNDTDMVQELLAHSQTFYPEQYEALTEIYRKSSANKRYFDFLRARRIVNCCFGENDSQEDIDEYGNRNYERVKCPLIAECKYYKIVCQPKFDSTLSERELEVMKMYFEHVPQSDIAERLYISIHTVINHKKNVLRKLKLHSLQEFQDYAHRNKIFK